MTRKMADPAFRQEQERQLHAPHIAPITALVDSLRREDKWMPYVAPLHGGVEARMMTVLRDPGPATAAGTGSGMLCTENDDQTAAKQCELMAQAGIQASDLTPWNAYPWYIHAGGRGPSARQLREASGVLLRMIDLMPQLKVVLLTGRESQAAWKIATRARPELLRRGFHVLETYHASAQALQTSDPLERAARIRHREQTWAEAGRLIR